ncbi:hypothetical protein GQ43DRAFT_437829 [Delitschia confertaspora ATCC 74209]|uniref:Uncharacterized protein n=1 Tax=Delitschia confertaspora ATCC 74209 TaxID=1513339 RepID=A0A9P4MVW1_9PLEO|nr:hypothetical protein GQ43DRAFT_437829 [Delitschia confertaspora ATCC 74209]
MANVSTGELKPIQALVLNAGYMSSYGQSFTQDGYEKAFQINYLVNFLLVHLFLPSMDRVHGQIIFITSFSHAPESKHTKFLPLPKELWKPAEVLAKPSPDPENKTKGGFRRYAESMMCSMILMHSLQARLDATEKLSNIIAFTVDPGVVGAMNIRREQDKASVVGHARVRPNRISASPSPYFKPSKGQALLQLYVTLRLEYGLSKDSHKTRLDSSEDLSLYAPLVNSALTYQAHNLILLF